MSGNCGKNFEEVNESKTIVKQSHSSKSSQNDQIPKVMAEVKVINNQNNVSDAENMLIKSEEGQNDQTYKN